MRLDPAKLATWTKIQLLDFTRHGVIAWEYGTNQWRAHWDGMGKPIGSGDSDFEAIRDLLRQTDYDAEIDLPEPRDY